ncbi:MAG: galactose-1-phosphate uridylyltransferase, partial [Ilumatobacteraceae bacterium]
DGDEPFAVHHLGPVPVEAEASGTHEVFVLSRDHDSGIHALTDADTAEMMMVLKRRFLEHAATANVRYTQAIINHGREAGASIAHPHGQLLGLPFVPGELLEEQRAFSRFEGGCILCATLEAELGENERVLFANDDVVCVCPFWSGSPYELLIIPRDHELHLTDATDTTLAAVGKSVRTAIELLRDAHGDVAYNIGFHTAPHHYNGAFHWHVHLWPKLVTTAGFERGTGVALNIVAPEVAAAHLLRQSVKA